MVHPLGISESRATIKKDWSNSPYYEDIEAATFVFWSDEWPFFNLFGQLNLENCIELACGHGRHTEKALVASSHFTLVDINKSNIDFCKKRFGGRPNVSFLVNDGSTLNPLQDGLYSSLFCYDAMVHFEMHDVIRYLDETYRILRPGGCGLFHFSNYDRAPGGHYHDNPHWRNFNSIAIFSHFATRAGFEIVTAKPVNWGDSIDLDGIALLRKPGSRDHRPPRLTPSSTSPKGSIVKRLVRRLSRS